MFLVTFLLAALGSVVCLAIGAALNFLARRARSESFAMGSGRGEAADPETQADPVLIFGFILGFYGAIALALVSALPGSYALERTGLVFAILCVGGLIAEISSAAPSPQSTDSDPLPAPRTRVSLKLSAALILMLNLAFSVLSSHQGLIEIVPPKASAVRSEELEPIVVVAQRKLDPLDDSSSLF